jgi:hypothetical protein
MSHPCSGSIHTFVSMGAVLKRQQLPNYRQLPVKWRAVVKHHWHPLKPIGVEIKQCEVSVRVIRQKDFRETWRGWLRH